MRTMLNRHVPLDAIIRWWYVLVALPAIGLVFSRVASPVHFPAIRKAVTVMEGSPPVEKTVIRLFEFAAWRDDLLLAVVGLLLACGVVWLLEEIRDSRQRMSDP